MIKLIGVDNSVNYLVDILKVVVSKEENTVVIVLTDGEQIKLEYSDHSLFNKLADLIDHNLGNGPSITVYESQHTFSSVLAEIEANRRKAGENPR